jgi:DMSO/TMAO reductase YedYZ molybdopterin-dependent catalytic subunit
MDQLARLERLAERAGLGRREFLALLVTSGAGAVLAACAPEARGRAPVRAPAGPEPEQGGLRSIIKPTPESDFIVHSPGNAEMRFERMARERYVTPNHLFYVRTHGAAPILSEKTWRLSITGSGVDKPLVLTYDELLALPSKTITRSIECAGNGRSFYDSLLGKKAGGDQWRLGAYGIAEWTGVPLAELLRRARIRKSAVEVMPVGLDVARVERPMPLTKALEEDTILAYRMNGETLPVDHGFPARVVVPGWVGVASVKWVGEIRVSETPIAVKWNTDEYVMIGVDYPPAPPAKGPPLTTGVPKSAVALPWPATLREGPQTVTGYAWSPFGKIERVDVSLDGGKTFRAATLVGPNIERAGTRWELSFEAKAGEMTITPRATDEKGNTQPELGMQKWNLKGYNFGAPVPHPVTVVR